MLKTKILDNIKIVRLVLGVSMKLLNDKIPYCNFFTFGEMACKDNENTLKVTEDSLRHAMIMDEFRVWWGEAIIPTSWYRTPSHNKAVRGAKFSKHMESIATDFKTERLQNKIVILAMMEWARICQKYGVTGAFFIYDWGLHLDSRKDNQFIWWDFRKGGLSG